MKRKHQIDPRARAAIDFYQADPDIFNGDICPRGLPAIIPKHGERRCWQDAVTVYLLSRIIGVHRVKKGGDPFWSGSLYKVDRVTLAREFACDPDVVSTALDWLVECGFVVRVRHTPIDGEGKACGTMIFAFPLMVRIHEALAYFDEHKKSMSASEWFAKISLEEGLISPSSGLDVPLKPAPTPPEAGAYLNCSQEQLKPATESGCEASPEQQHPDQKDRRSRADAFGGGEAATDYMQVPPPPAATTQAAPAPAAAPRPSALAPGTDPSPSEQPQRHVAVLGSVLLAPPAPWTPPPLPRNITPSAETERAWCRASRFCEMWGEALVRLGHVDLCVPTAGDLKSAFHFFSKHTTVDSFRAVAVAIDAWELSLDTPRDDRWDNLYRCRRSTEIQAFLRNLVSGKLESEIDQARLTINVYNDLRQAFTETELRCYGWKEVPVVAIDPEMLWEFSTGAPQYYAIKSLKAPPEVTAVLTNGAATTGKP